MLTDRGGVKQFVAGEQNTAADALPQNNLPQLYSLCPQAHYHQTEVPAALIDLLGDSARTGSPTSGSVCGTLLFHRTNISYQEVIQCWAEALLIILTAVNDTSTASI